MNVTKRFLEVCSAYRDRNIYPNPSTFEIPFGNSLITTNYNTARDVITKGPIYFTWQGGSTGARIVSEGTVKSISTTNSSIAVTQTASVPTQTLTLGPSGPSILSELNNYYVGFGFRDVTTSEDRLIVNYNASSGLFNLNTPLNTGATTNDYIIYDPSISTIIHLPSVDSLGNKILSYPECYNGYYIMDETLSYGTSIVARKIISYDYLTQLATLDQAFPSGWDPTDVYTLRQTLPVEKWAVSSATNNIVQLPGGASSNNNYYNNNFVYESTVSGTAGTTAPLTSLGANTNKIYYINSYNGTTKDLTLSLVNNNATTFPVATDVINIVPFVRDNCVPLLYSGSLASQEQSVCYEIGITDITIPNVLLSTGSRIINYPYVYVSLEAVSSSSGGMINNIFYSNNPNSSRALFIVTQTDSQQPINSAFLKTDSGSMVVTMKFKPNDTLRFSMWLPDGTPFKTLQDDNVSPYPCNPLLQITCVFSIRSLSN